MEIFEGIGVSPGIALGAALVIDYEGIRIPRHFVDRDAVDEALERLNRAFEDVAGEIDGNRRAASEKLGEQYGAIFSAHLQMLRDPKLHNEITEFIRERNYSPEYAVSRTLRRYAKVLRSLEDGFFADRANDLYDIERRLLSSLLGRKSELLGDLSSPVIVLAHDLTPSETANLNPEFVKAFATEVGGKGGHTAIVAEAMGIPAIVGIGPFLTKVQAGDEIIVDGGNGRLTLHPEEASIKQFEQKSAARQSRGAALQETMALPAITRDETRIYLGANIEFPSEVNEIVAVNADGVGLYRTEFLYLGAEKDPTEEEHFEAYSSVVTAMQGKPVIMRTLDLGADKLGRLPRGEEKNPFLGLRSIRLSLRHPEQFRLQLRAILRASALGKIRVMFPLIATMGELRRAKELLRQAMEELESEGIQFDRDLEVGMMVEAPSAVVLIEKFLQEVDFISIGTNDLIQYALAVDRTNPDVAELYRASDPAVLNLIQTTLRAADAKGISATLCGQMSAQPQYTMLLLGLGLRGLSMPPGALPAVKRVCLSVTLDQCREVAEKVMEMDDPQKIDSFLESELFKAVPELALE